jgi:uncharacterized protein (DUF1330 family)
MRQLAEPRHYAAHRADRPIFGTPGETIPMPAYVIVDIDIHDAVGYEEYKRLAASTVTAHGGRYLARGGATHVLEGDRVPHRLVVLEFPTVAKARRWWDSPEYQPIKRIRQRCARTEMVVVEGA